MISVSPGTAALALLTRVVELEDALTCTEHAEDMGLAVSAVQELAAELTRRGLLAPRLYRLARHVRARLAAGGAAPRDHLGPDPSDDILVTLTREAALSRGALALAVDCMGEKQPTGQFKRAVDWLVDAGTLSTPLDLHPSAEGLALVQGIRAAA